MCEGRFEFGLNWTWCMCPTGERQPEVQTQSAGGLGGQPTGVRQAAGGAAASSHQTRFPCQVGSTRIFWSTSKLTKSKTKTNRLPPTSFAPPTRKYDEKQSQHKTKMRQAKQVFLKATAQRDQVIQKLENDLVLASSLSHKVTHGCRMLLELPSLLNTTCLCHEYTSVFGLLLLLLFRRRRGSVRWWRKMRSF